MEGRRFDELVRRRSHCSILIGVDEAGRGPWAGPVVVAAVSLPRKPSARLSAVKDSKRMTARARQASFEAIRKEALAISIAWAHTGVIDRDNILRATLSAMSRAAQKAARQLTSPPVILVDGPHSIPGVNAQVEAIVDGDDKSLCIAAASVVAKVIRDRWMRTLELRYPGYGFSQHKGYGTKVHALALESKGPCPAHRRSFAPVAAKVAQIL